jgi:hypothetical protein
VQQQLQPFVAAAELVAHRDFVQISRRKDNDKEKASEVDEGMCQFYRELVPFLRPLPNQKVPDVASGQTQDTLQAQQQPPPSPQTQQQSSFETLPSLLDRQLLSYHRWLKEREGLLQASLLPPQGCGVSEELLPALSLEPLSASSSGPKHAVRAVDAGGFLHHIDKGLSAGTCTGTGTTALAPGSYGLESPEGDVIAKALASAQSGVVSSKNALKLGEHLLAQLWLYLPTKSVKVTNTSGSDSATLLDCVAAEELHKLLLQWRGLSVQHESILTQRAAAKRLAAKAKETMRAAAVKTLQSMKTMTSPLVKQGLTVAAEKGADQMSVNSSTNVQHTDEYAASLTGHENEIEGTVPPFSPMGAAPNSGTNDSAKMSSNISDEDAFDDCDADFVSVSSAKSLAVDYFSQDMPVSLGRSGEDLEAELESEVVNGKSGVSSSTLSANLYVMLQRINLILKIDVTCVGKDYLQRILAWMSDELQLMYEVVTAGDFAFSPAVRHYCQQSPWEVGTLCC